MSKLVRSTVCPEPLHVDRIVHGAADLRCRWDIHEVEVEDDTGTRTEWEYTEQVIIGWALDTPGYLTRENGRQVLTDAGRQYFAESKDEILLWAQTAGV